MKKLTVVLLSAVVLTGLAACGKDENATKEEVKTKTEQLAKKGVDKAEFAAIEAITADEEKDLSVFSQEVQDLIKQKKELIEKKKASKDGAEQKKSGKEIAEIEKKIQSVRENEVKNEVANMGGLSSDIQDLIKQKQDLINQKKAAGNDWKKQKELGMKIGEIERQISALKKQQNQQQANNDGNNGQVAQNDNNQQVQQPQEQQQPQQNNGGGQQTDNREARKQELINQKIALEQQKADAFRRGDRAEGQRLVGEIKRIQQEINNLYR